MTEPRAGTVDLGEILRRTRAACVVSLVAWAIGLAVAGFIMGGLTADWVTTVVFDSPHSDGAVGKGLALTMLPVGIGSAAAVLAGLAGYRADCAAERLSSYEREAALRYLVRARVAARRCRACSLLGLPALLPALLWSIKLGATGSWSVSFGEKSLFALSAVLAAAALVAIPALGRALSLMERGIRTSQGP